MTTNDKTLAARLGDGRGPVGRSFRYDNTSARERLPVAVPIPREFASRPFAPLRMATGPLLALGTSFSSLVFRQTRQKTRFAHSTHMDERNAMQMIENNQSRHVPLDTLVSVECSVHLANVLIQSGAPDLHRDARYAQDSCYA
jgi:hypothetical protein